MGHFCQFVLLGGIRFTMAAFGISNNTTNQRISQRLSCKNNIHVIFASDTWEMQIRGKNTPRFINQERFFTAVIEKIVSTVDGTQIY